MAECLFYRVVRSSSHLSMCMELSLVSPALPRILLVRSMCGQQHNFCVRLRQAPDEWVQELAFFALRTLHVVAQHFTSGCGNESDTGVWGTIQQRLYAARRTEHSNGFYGCPDFTIYSGDIRRHFYLDRKKMASRYHTQR
jgi:hypothetical protein